MDDIFRMPDYSIGLGQRYKLRDGAPASHPQVPDLVQVRYMPTGQNKVEFYDVAHPSSTFTLTTADFREVYDPAA